MTEPVETKAFEHEFVGYPLRAGHVRQSRSIADDSHARAERIEAALLELEVATEELKVIQEETLGLAEREEIIAGFARQLLSCGVTLRQAGRALLDALADWVFVDLLTDGEWRREIVLPGGKASMELLHALSEPGELSRRVHLAGRPHLGSPADNPRLLGLDEGGVPLAFRMSAGSVVCVPLRADGEAFGAVTLVRKTGARPAFTIADTVLAEELCRCLAMRIRLDAPNWPHDGETPG